MLLFLSLVELNGTRRLYKSLAICTALESFRWQDRVKDVLLSVLKPTPNNFASLLFWKPKQNSCREDFDTRNFHKTIVYLLVRIWRRYKSYVQDKRPTEAEAFFFSFYRTSRQGWALLRFRRLHNLFPGIPVLILPTANGWNAEWTLERTSWDSNSER